MKIITAEELRAFLREHDLTATALAREAGVSVQAITRPLQHKKSGRNPWLGVEASRKVIPAMERIAKRPAPQPEKEVA